MDFQNFYNMVTRGSDSVSDGGGVAPSSTTTAITSGGLSGSTSSTTSLPQPPPTHASSASRGSMDLSGSGSGLVATGPVGLPGPLSSSAQSYNSVNASTSTSSGGAAHGIDVPAGPTFTFTPPPADSFPQLPCTPIALYASENAYTSGRLITVSDTYICYAIKDGHIRAINRHSVIRTLLKGHKKPVIDLAFAAGSNNTLVSLAGDGSAIVWRLLERAVGADGSKVELTYAVVLHITDIGLSRAVWHPQQPEVLAMVKANEASVVDYTHLLPEGSSTTTPVTIVAATLNDLKPDYKLPSHQNIIQDISFSKDGRYLATAGADGWVRVYDTEQRSIVGRWQPYGGAAATRVLFLHRTAGPTTGEKVFLCTGGKMDSELKLWRAWTTLVPTCTQTITIDDQDAKGHAFHVEGDDTGEFIFIADSLRPVLYVSSVTLTPSSARIHRLTPFQLKHPVLSLLSMAGVSINAHEGQADPSSAEIQLYCVQTQAIQLYHLKAADCKAPPTTTPTATADGPASSLSVPTPPSPPTDTTTTPNNTTTAATSSSDTSSSSLSSSTEDGSQGGGVTPPAPPNTPSTTVEPPAILKMLLQATAAKDHSPSASASGSGGGGGVAVPPTQPPPPTLLTPSALSAGTLPVPHPAEETVTQTTSTPATEEKQTGGAHTTEQQQQQQQQESVAQPQPPSSASGEDTSSAASPEGATPHPPSAGQGSRDASGTTPTAPAPPQATPSLPPQPPTTHATPPPHPPSLPPPSAPPSTPTGSTASAIPPPTVPPASAVPPPQVPPPPPPQPVFDEAKFARLFAATESRIAQGVANATAAMAEEFERRTRAVVAQALAGFGPDLQQGVSASVAQSVTQRVDKSVRSTVAQHIDNIVPNLINKSMTDMTQAVAASVREPVLVSFKQCFAEQLIPAVSSATQRMFAQFNDALTKGLAGPASSGEAVQQQLVALRSDVSSLTMAVGTLTGQLEGLSEKLDSLSTSMAAGGGEGAGGMLGPAVLRGASGAGTPAARSQTKEELKRVMRQGYYDDAFKQALGASDLELVTWLCNEAPKDEIFDAEPPLLSPTVLLCLMQQLSFNLDLDTPLKLEWLKQISLVLNIADPEIAALPVGGVLDQLHQNLEGAAALLRGANDVRDLRFVHKAVRRMMQDHKARRP